MSRDPLLAGQRVNTALVDSAGRTWVGMERNGKSPEVIRQIRQAYKILYKNNLRLEDAIEEMEGMAGESNELSNMVSFLRNVTRGILR